MEFIQKISSVTKDEVFLQKKLANYTTFGVGGKAKYFVTPSSLESLISIINIAKQNSVKYFLLGKGSNLLISDDGFDGLVISTARLKKLSKSGDCIYAESGVTVCDLLTFCVKNNLGGIEYLSGIPATVGGLISTGAGAFNHNFAEDLSQVAVLKDGFTSLVNYLPPRYRVSPVAQTDAILFAVIKCKESNCVRQNLINFSSKRNVPAGKSCGSVFKNPNGLFVGKLIEDCNLKGFSVGGAVVSTKHANFIINTGTATAKDIHTLIGIIKNAVKDKFGVEIQTEVRLVGEF